MDLWQLKSGQLPAGQTATMRPQSPCLQISCSNQTSDTNSLFVSAPCSLQTVCSYFHKHTQLLCDRSHTKTNILPSNNPETENTALIDVHNHEKTTTAKESTEGSESVLSHVIHGHVGFGSVCRQI